MTLNMSAQARLGLDANAVAQPFSHDVVRYSCFVPSRQACKMFPALFGKSGSFHLHARKTREAY